MSAARGAQLEQIASAFLRGERAAVAEIAAWARYACLPFRARLGDDLEDLVQECLLDLTEALRAERFRGESSLETYVRRMVNHRCIDRLRASRRWRWSSVDDIEPVAREASPLRQAADREAYRHFLRALERLPASCRAMWSLVVEGCSYDEMSRRLGVAPGTLRVRLLRCRRRAQALLARLEAPAGGNAGAGPTSMSEDASRGATGRST